MNFPIVRNGAYAPPAKTKAVDNAPSASGALFYYGVLAFIIFLLFGGLFPSGGGSLLRWRSADGWSPCSNPCGPGIQTRVVNKCGTVEERTCYGPGVLGCDGKCNSKKVVDCAGVCGGSAKVDKCGVCGGNNKDLGCDGKCFSSYIKDCTGKCGGNAVVDDCGVCNGHNKDKGCDGKCFSKLEEDCTGVCGGPVKPDSCGVCGGNDKDKGCDGVCFSRKVKDCKGVCGGKNLPDKCGVCGGGDKDLGCDGTCFSAKKKDCAGVCGGSAMPDDCGVCEGSNKDKDCSGVCFGKAYFDASGSCVLSPNSRGGSGSSHSRSFGSFSSSSMAGAATAAAAASNLPYCGAEPAPAPAPSCGAPAPSCGCAAAPGVVSREQVGPSLWTQVLLRVAFITLLGGAIGTAVIRYLLGPRIGGDTAITMSYVKENIPAAEWNARSWAARRRAVRALCVVTASAAAQPNSDRPKAALAALVRLASPGSRGSVYLCFVCGALEAGVSIMAVCRANVGVLTNVCTLFHQLASTPSTVAKVRHHPDVANAKVPIAVLSVLRLFPTEPRACEAAAAALWSFAFGSGSFVQTALVRADAHLDLMAAIVRFPSDVPVLYRACGALMALALRNPEAQKTMGEAGAAHLLMETLTNHRELNYGGDFSELRIWMRKYAAERPRPLLESAAGVGAPAGAPGAESAGSRWWAIVRDQGPIPDTAFRVITLPTQANGKA